MSKAIEQSLTGLIPTLSGPLPPDLINLALALLTQSRSKASSLKPEEEIARPYACAQIACERLKQRLDLPKIVSRPPCAPPVYKKLHAYLTTVLPQRQNRSAPSTPQKVNKTTKTPIQTPSRRTPAKGTPQHPTPSKRGVGTSKKAANDDNGAPDWFLPAIRHLCKAFSKPAATPHVYTGVCTILALQNTPQTATTPRASSRARRATAAPAPAQPEPITQSQTPALIAVLLLYVLARMSDQETTPEDFMQQRDKTVEVLCGMDAAEQTDEEEMLADIDRFMRLAQSDGWVQMEWYLNIVAGEAEDELGQENGARGDGDAVVGLRRRQRRTDVDMQDYGDGERLEIGLGTMMQEKLDYFSEERRLEYLEWKEGFLARVEQLEREQAAARRRGDEMELDS
ncbi:uncharacterized protein BDZ99DRAFT_496476 [Mytilinidion resinicola]|uniref:ORC6 first cyclin-like domain-containing protein n=1 Tax=Mytilinidion resinicola TaxID=574789 RepID=A0A6A6YX40_9PEZI|nr:uncharacterized protein BDZ99DRAFT_496476 [Mytilinidion resinicola]KAF2813502.1 hypothetical protein BDZ99DRAFT_496476 [Mytilinidion resinicola]